MDPVSSAPLRSAPWYFRLLKNCNRRNMRGSSMALKQLGRMGMLDKPAFYRMSDQVGIEVPIGRFSNSWDQQDVDQYEEDLLQSLMRVAGQLQPPVTLIDGGADIGVFSLKVASRCPALRRIIAFEPNPEPYVWLKRNLDRLPYETLALAKAVSDFEGRGALRYPSYDPESAHACYLEQSPDGPIEVVTVDSVDRNEGQDLILKLDLEGAEIAALRGAAGTIRRARRAVVVLEAHPAVVKRTGIDSVECLRLLSSIRDFRFFASETGQAVAADRPVFEQLAPGRIYNIIGEST